MPRIGEYVSLISLGLLVGVSLFTVSPILPQYVESYGVSYIDVGFFFTAYSLTWAVLQLYTGHLSDRYGRKRFVFLGLLIYGVFALLLGFAQNFSFPVMPFIVTYLATFGLRTPFLLLTGLMLFSGITFLAAKK